MRPTLLASAFKLAWQPGVLATITVSPEGGRRHPCRVLRRNVQPSAIRLCAKRSVSLSCEYFVARFRST